MKVICSVIFCILFLQPVFADQLSGSKDPELRTAIDVWLSYDDQKSLPVMAKLAKSGNIAARLLLAGIEKNDYAPSPYLASLTQQKRLKLLRGPRGKSPFYPSWIEVEARRGHKLALALRQALSPKVDVDLLKQLNALGERQATEQLARIIGIYGKEEILKEVLAKGIILDEQRPYIQSNISPAEKIADGLNALRMMVEDDSLLDLSNIDYEDPENLNALHLLSMGIPYGIVKGTNRWRPTLEKWLFTAETTRPIANTCRKKCPTEAFSCGVTILGLTRGFFELIRLDSPLESVIPQSEFLRSERARRMTLRRAAFTLAEPAGMRLPTIEEIAAHSQCLANLVRIEREII